MHKKTYFLITLSLNGLLQPSDQQKTFTPSDSTQSLTPYSPNSETEPMVRTTLPSIQSFDQFTGENNPEHKLKLAKEQLQAATYQHQKLLERLQKNKAHFFANQEREAESNTFSRWEKINNKPKKFETEQKNAAKVFLATIEKQLVESQAYELACLKEFQESYAAGPVNRSSKKFQQLLQQQAQEQGEMEVRHSLERHSIRSEQEPSTKAKLLKMWNGE